MIYRGAGFLAVVWFGSSPAPSPPLLSASRLSLSQSPFVSPVELADVRGGGWGRSQTIRRQESLVLYKSFNTLYNKDFAVSRRRTCSYLLTYVQNVQRQAAKRANADVPDSLIYCGVPRCLGDKGCGEVSKLAETGSRADWKCNKKTRERLIDRMTGRQIWSETDGQTSEDRQQRGGVACKRGRCSFCCYPDEQRMKWKRLS